jgi:hypothetical protein
LENAWRRLRRQCRFFAALLQRISRRSFGLGLSAPPPTPRRIRTNLVSTKVTPSTVHVAWNIITTRENEAVDFPLITFERVH